MVDRLLRHNLLELLGGRSLGRRLELLGYLPVVQRLVLLSVRKQTNSPQFPEGSVSTANCHNLFSYCTVFYPWVYLYKLSIGYPYSSNSAAHCRCYCWQRLLVERRLRM